MPVTFSPAEVVAYYRVRLPKLNQHGHEWRGPCPIHGGERDSFAVEAASGRWTCHSECQRGGDILDLEQALAKVRFGQAKDTVLRMVGRTQAPAGKLIPPRIVATYDYQDESGTMRFQVVRFGPKGFAQRHPDGRGGWVWNLNGIESLPYRLPQLLQDKKRAIFLCEGEKDVHTLEAWGLVASCNPGGAGSSHLYGRWREYFKSRHVLVLPDNDEPGRRHAAAVAATLLPVTASLRVIELPGLPEKGDVTDWRNAGGTREELLKIAKAAPVLTAAALSELRQRWRIANEKPCQSARAETGSLVTRRLSEIDAKPVSWLWPTRLARGKVSIIAGNPGLGKSQITASIAATVTTGGQWPVDRTQCTAGKVVFLSAEDDPADTLRPRLEAAGANLDRVHILDAVISGYTGEGQPQNRAFSLQRDVEALSAKLAELGDVAAVVIDPITAYLGDIDSHRNAEVRALLAPLSELAAQHGTAIIGVSHLNKSAGTEALMRVTGSLAFVAAARAAYLVAQSPENPSRRLFLPMKNNIGPDSTGLAFSIEGATILSGAGPMQTSKVAWEPEPVTTTADEVMRPQPQEHVSVLQDAKEWLLETLSEPTSVTEVSRLAVEVGISKKTLRRASEALGVVRGKAGMKAGWVWSLPPKMPKKVEDAQQDNLGTFGDLGHLRESEVDIVEVEL